MVTSIQCARPAALSLPKWKVHRYDVVGSTNDLAARLPAWSAVVATSQENGRGRHGRHWISNTGGLWLSAVVPTPGPALLWATLPLAAGWAVREALATLGVRDLRLRWPNDVMVGRAKLAGILVERFRPDAAVIGLGLNFANDPAAAEPELAGHTTRLADLLPTPPARAAVLDRLLDHFAIAQSRLAHDGIEALLPTLNTAWRNGRVRIEFTADSSTVDGDLVGVDARGRLRLRTVDDHELLIDPLQVHRLRELGPQFT